MNANLTIPHSAGSTTIMAQLTPPGRGAIASLHVRGPRALAAVAPYFRSAQGRRPDQLAVGRIHYGRWSDAKRTEDVVLCRRADDAVEIHCHGGPLAIEAIKDDLRETGVGEIPWSAWVDQQAATRIQAEAWEALARATTELTAAILLSQYNGALQRRVEEIQTRIDQNDLQAATAALDQLSRTARWGMHLVNPWQITLVGPANVGKSSLVNAILGFQRAIVHDQPGTTRDVVSAATTLAGWPMEFSDTAGLRQTREALEAEGMQRTWQRVQQADQVVLVIDADQCASATYRELRSKLSGSIFVLNKMDQNPDAAQYARWSFDVYTSAVTGAGIAQLLEVLAARLVPPQIDTSAGMLFTVRQTEWVRAAREALSANDMDVACDALRQLLGRRDNGPAAL